MNEIFYGPFFPPYLYCSHNILLHDLNYTVVNRNTSLSFADWRFLASNAVESLKHLEDLLCFLMVQEQIISHYLPS